MPENKEETFWDDYSDERIEFQEEDYHVFTNDKGKIIIVLRKHTAR